MSAAHWPSRLPFADTRADRAALARERFFEEGQLPTGLVDETVLQSWKRCLAEQRQPGDAVQVQPVSRLRLEAALRRSRQLRDAAQGELQNLQRALSQASCTILLLDAEGLVICASTPASKAQGGLIRAIARPGVDVSERALGTNAPGLVLRTGRTCTIGIGEHYFEQIAALRCAAAPIRDIHGRIAGVLDLTVEQAGFGFDPAALVALHAGAMQRALMLRQAMHQTLVELHVHPQLLGVPGSGLIGVDEDGSVAWLDADAERFTGARAHLACERPSCEEVLGIGLAALLAAAGRENPTGLSLPNGLGVWVRVRMPARCAMAAPRTAPEPQPQVPAASSPASLIDRHRQLISGTLSDCAGNVSEAARRLGISRGRVYRALRDG